MLLIKVRRKDKRVTFEYGITFLEGNQIDSALLTMLFWQMEKSFEIKYASSVRRLG
jgi:hypothetical protein